MKKNLFFVSLIMLLGLHCLLANGYDGTMMKIHQSLHYVTLPYSEDFESYTISTNPTTGVEPSYWELVQEDVAMTNATRPQLYYKSTFAHSGNYSLKLTNRGVYAMPALSEDVAMSQVKLGMYLRQPKKCYRLQVGVWDDETETFTPITTFNNSSTELEFVECDFSNYTGNGRRIAFRNVLSSGVNLDYSNNYIDDIMLTDISGLHCGITLPYAETFETYTENATPTTGEAPNCWELVQEDVAMTNATRPQLYYKSTFAHSGNYSLKLTNRGVYAMPALSEDVAMSQVKLGMYLRQPKKSYRLQVGVWDDETGTFTLVTTFNNSSTEVEFVECDFSNYTGNGRRIAFRNVLSSGVNLDYSHNYIDDIILTNISRLDCEIMLPYAESFETYTESTTPATGESPTCWKLVKKDVSMTSATRPQLYYKSAFAHSGNYSLRLVNRGVYAMPALSEEIVMSHVKLEMYLRQPNRYYQLQVGVWDDVTGTFTEVTTFNNNNTELEFVECDFSNYTGNGRRIAFRNVLNNSVNYAYSYNYIDDISLKYLIPEGDAQPCPGHSTEVDIDGNIYNTVKIGEQCWMKENMRALHYSDGQSVGEIFYPDHDINNVSTYGVLYRRVSAFRSVDLSSDNVVLQGVCPAGWHVPNSSDIEQLTNYLQSVPEYYCDGATYNKAIASNFGWTPANSNCNAGNNMSLNNSTGLSIMPAGFKNWGFGTTGFFWVAPRSFFGVNDVNYYSWYGFDSDALPIRCVRGQGSDIPQVVADSITRFTDTSMRCFGHLLRREGVSECGFCWDTLPNPTRMSNTIVVQPLETTFISEISGLQYSKTYYIRAYAVNETGVGYSDVMTMSTPFPPAISLDSIHIASPVLVVCGSVINDGGTPIQERGICFGKDENPTVNGNSWQDNAMESDSFCFYGDDFEVGTFLHVRAYAVNAAGITYSNDTLLLFTNPLDGQPCTNAPTMTDIDGNVYPTVQLGRQCWIAQNLRTTQNNAEEIPLYSLQTPETNEAMPCRYYPDDDPNKVEPFGYMYNWTAVLGKNGPANTDSSYCQGICPDGWHVPSIFDWRELMNYVGAQPQYRCDNNPSYVLNALADSIYASNINCSGSSSIRNSTGFSLRASGWYYLGHGLGKTYMQWSSSMGVAHGYGNLPNIMYTANSSPRYVESEQLAVSGMAVRCVKNPEGVNFGGSVNINSYYFSEDTLVVVVSDVSAFGSPIVEIGACWAKGGYHHSGGSPCVNFFNSQTIPYNSAQSGPFYIKLPNVNTSEALYFRAFINLETGTVYSDRVRVPATTSCGTVTDYDGNVYGTILIDNQCWMRENLRTTHTADGNPILFTEDSMSYTTPYYYDYSSSGLPLEVRGYLYNWPAAMVACPTGWHLPSNTEWTSLTNYISAQSEYISDDDSSHIAKALAYPLGWITPSPLGSMQTNNNNASGFSIVPAGNTFFNSYYNRMMITNVGSYTALWSSTEDGNNSAYTFSLWSLFKNVNMYSMDRNIGYSVRCLRDEMKTSNHNVETDDNPNDTISVNSATEMAYVNTPLSIEGGANGIDYFAIYPNPTTNIVNAQCTMHNAQWDGVEIQLFDMYGKFLNSVPVTNETTQINLSCYAKGVYFLKLVRDSKMVAVQKVVKR